MHDVRRTHGRSGFLDIIDRAIDSGINFLDTANVYSAGAEEVVGKLSSAAGSEIA